MPLAYFFTKNRFRVSKREQNGQFTKFIATLDYYFDKAKRKIEHYKKVSRAHKGRTLSKPTKKKISEGKKGQVPWNKGLSGKEYLTHFGGKMPMQGRRHSYKTREKIRKSHLGKNIGPWNQAQRDKIPKALKGIKRPWVSERNKDPVFISKVLKSLVKRPTYPEQQFMGIVKNNNLPFDYTGDGRKIMGNRCPDFVNTKSQKHVVEIFGSYFHSREMNPKVLYERTYDGTMEYYKNQGVHCTILWDFELNDERLVLEKLGGDAGATSLLL